MNKAKKKGVRRVLFELVALAAIPVFVHLVGNFIVNNFGGVFGGAF